MQKSPLQWLFHSSVNFAQLYCDIAVIATALALMVSMPVFFRHISAFFFFEWCCVQCNSHMCLGIFKGKDVFPEVPDLLKKQFVETYMPKLVYNMAQCPYYIVPLHSKTAAILTYGIPISGIYQFYILLCPVFQMAFGHRMIVKKALHFFPHCSCFFFMEIPILSLLGLFLKRLQFSGFTESAAKLISKTNEL